MPHNVKQFLPEGVENALTTWMKRALALGEDIAHAAAFLERLPSYCQPEGRNLAAKLRHQYHLTVEEGKEANEQLIRHADRTYKHKPGPRPSTPPAARPAVSDPDPDLDAGEPGEAGDPEVREELGDVQREGGAE